MENLTQKITFLKEMSKMLSGIYYLRLPLVDEPLLYLSPTAEQIFHNQYTRIQQLGFSAISHEIVTSNWHKIIDLEMLLSPENPQWDFHWKWLSSNRKYYLFRDHGVGIFSDQGKLLALQGRIEDVTNHSLREEQLLESEEQFRSIIDLSPFSVLLINNSSQIEYVNHSFLEEFHFERSQMLDVEQWLSLLFPNQEQRSQFRRDLRQYKNASPGAYSTPRLYTMQDGLLAEHQMLLRVLTLPEEQLCIFSENITERIQTQLKYMESEEKYRELVMMSPNAIGIFQEEKAVFVNPGFCKMLDIKSHTDLIGTDLLDIIIPSERGIIKDYRRRRFLNGEVVPINYQTVLLCPNGTEKAVEVFASVIIYQGKPATQILFLDRTLHMESQRERERFQEITEERNKEITDLLNATIHDLRTPLLNIFGFSKEMNRLLEMENTIEETNKEQLFFALQQVKEGSFRMNQLIHALSGLTKSGALTLEITTVDTTKLLAKCQDLLQHKITDTKATLTYSQLHPCQTDKNQLQQVFLNLLENSLKYAHPERLPHIKITSQLQDGQIVLSFRDNGMGIPEHLSHDVFLPFFRNQSVEKIQGDGLGLAIVRRSLLRLKGQIKLISHEIGCEFRVYLPRTRE